MNSHQRIRVTEGRACPRRRLVARLTVSGEPCRGVVGIGRCVVIVEVAIDTLRRETGVHAPRVTGAALLGAVRPDQGPHRVRVGGLEPVRIRLLMTAVARRREPCRRVIRIRGGVVVVQVAVNTVGRQTCIHAARVAIRAIDGRVDSHQRIRVTEGRACPRRRLVARLAIGGEPCRGMVGIGCSVVVVEVAIDTFRRETGVHAPCVTGAALLSNVRADQRPHRMRVRGLEPVRIRLFVTGVARRREPCSRVVRVRCGVVIVQVTIHAVGRQACVHTARVAIRAIDGRVNSHQRIRVDEASRRPVVPRSRIVALLAIGWETSGAVVRIVGRLIVIEVAPNAISGSPRVNAIRVAGRAVQRRVYATQGERMIEIPILPRAVGPVVAEIAGRGETRRAVVGIGRSLVVVQVAADAGPGCARVDSISVACCAFQGCVLAAQAVVVIENSLIPRNIAGAVADIALRRKARGHVVRFPSTLVISAVARIAVRGDGSVEPAIRVAANTVDSLMLPTNCKPGLRLVIPFGWDPPNRLVASFAIRSEIGTERILLSADPMAVVTIGGSALDLLVPVTRCTGNFKVPAFERQQGRLVEPAGSVFKVGVHRVADGAVVTQRALVDILVAGRAIRCQIQK